VLFQHNKVKQLEQLKHFLTPKTALKCPKSGLLQSKIDLKIVFLASFSSKNALKTLVFHQKMLKKQVFYAC